MKRIKCYNYAGDYVNSLVQWDRNQVVYVDDLENGAIPGVHYASTGYKDVSWEFTDVASLADDNRIKIKIPDIMMQYDGKLYLFLFYGENETIATTKYVIELTVKEKPKPDDWVWADETWYKTMQQIQIDVNKVLSITESKVNNPSEGKVGQILEIASVDMNGKPLTYIAVDKPRSITDDDIISPIATVTQTDTGATISIQDKNGTTTANIIHGRDGKDGENGQDGYTPVKGVDYFDGEKGDKGDKGDDGYTPQKGVDYFDGQDGKDGEKGADGTSVTVSNVSESIADGGSNVVTFSDGKTLTIKNGSKGKDGEKGEDGKDYVLTDTDKQEIVQTIEDNVSVNIPTKTSQLENDSDYVTKDVTDNLSEQLANKEASGTAQSKVAEHNTAEDSHNDIRLLITNLSNLVSNLLDSDDETLNQTSEIVAYIKSNKTLIDAITTSKVSISDIVDNLTTNVSNKPLSAKQGLVLKGLIDAIVIPTLLSQLGEDANHRTVTDAEKSTWNAKSNFSGAYADLSGKPTIPSKTSQLTNDSGFLTSVPSEYVTETELAAKKYLTSIPSEYVTETELSAKKYATQTDVNKFGGTIEVTSGNPTKENTVLTINPSAEEINVYTVDEVDAITSRLEGQITGQQDCVTPQMYGAIGDGVADDTQAINDALASGKNVFFPAGTYKVTSSLVTPYAISLSGASGMTTIKTYIISGYVFKSESSNVVESLNIQDIKFQNCNTPDGTTKLAQGDFIYDATALYMRNCRVYNYYNVFYTIHQNSYVTNCRFLTIYNRFCHVITDSIVDSCYINASRFAFPYKSKVFSASLNSTAFTNNLVDYFFDVFALTSSASGTITGNVFNRCVNIFHDHIAKMTIVGNIFTGMRSSEVDLSVLTSEQIASLEAEKWCVIKFDNAIYTGTHLMTNVTFANNIGHRCDYYFYVSDDAQVVPAFCDFRGNQISDAQGNNGDSIVDVGFRNADATINAYNSMHNVYFDFWDMKEYETLPSAKLIGNNAKSVFTFPYMKAVYNGDIYTNINGVWVKGGGGDEVNLSSYVTKAELNEYVTEAELSNEITLLKAQGVQQTPLFANSVEECTDKTKVYILPDGYIYGYIKTTTEVDGGTRPNFTNLKDTCYYNFGYRYSLSSGGYKAISGGGTVVVPVPSEESNITVRFKGFTFHKSYVYVYGGTSNTSFTEELDDTTGVYPDDNEMLTRTFTKPVGITHIAFHITATSMDDLVDTIITVNEPIEYITGSQTVVTEGFANTGHAFPFDGENRIKALETKVAELVALHQ